MSRAGSVLGVDSERPDGAFLPAVREVSFARWVERKLQPLAVFFEADGGEQGD